jgi:hypothetical protein
MCDMGEVREVEDILADCNLTKSMLLVKQKNKKIRARYLTSHGHCIEMWKKGVCDCANYVCLSYYNPPDFYLPYVTVLVDASGERRASIPCSCNNI